MSLRQRGWWRRGVRAPMVAGVGLGVMALGLGITTARAQTATATTTTTPATFALVVGVNQSIDGDAAVLRYADDDAVRFRDLFRTVGARTYLLTRMDENTRRLYPSSAPDVPPRLENLQATVAEIGAEVAAARRRGQHTVFYLIYAGHGTAGESGGYVTLEDARLAGSDLLARIIDPVAAAETHVIVDACNSFFLVLDRGPGGQRRALAGFAPVGAIAQRRDIGLLLSTSSARESHEWAAFQAGVFSHEVRSGLYGAADADGNGVISYTEMAAFIDRANSAVPNERFRPEVFSRAPDGAGRLLDLRAAPTNRIEVTGAVSGHYYLEDTSGVRLADFNSDADVRLVRPSPDKLYLRRAGADDREFVLPPSATTLRTAALVLQESHAAVRGAANDAFNTLFALPFGTDVVVAYGARADLLTQGAASPGQGATGPARARRWAGALAGVAGLALVSAGVFNYLDARSLRSNIDASTPQDIVAGTNDRVAAKNRNTAVFLGVGAAAVGTAAVLLLWPDSPVELAVMPSGWAAGWRGTF